MPAKRIRSSQHFISEESTNNQMSISSLPLELLRVILSHLPRTKNSDPFDSDFSALANAHRPSACCIKFDVPALSPSADDAAIFPHGEDFHPHSEWEGEGERGAGSLDGRSRRGFSQCRFHAEKWGICHHLRVDSDNGTATATMGISPGMERKRSTANEGGRKGGAGSRLGKRNGCKWRTNSKRKLSCHAMPATP